MNESKTKGFISANKEQTDATKNLKPYVAPKKTLIDEMEIESGGQMMDESNMGNLS